MEDDHDAYRKRQEKLQALEAEAEDIRAEAPKEYAEADKAAGTAFLLIDAEGKVSREFRVPKPTRKQSANGNSRHDGNGGGNGKADRQPTLTPADLSDGQLAATFTHQCLPFSRPGNESQIEPFRQGPSPR